jgi:hypothetical protein
MDAPTLETYKRTEIAKIVAQYNQTILNLNNSLKNQLNRINSLRMSLQTRRATITNLINTYYSLVNNATKMKNEKLIEIQNLRPTNRSSEKTALLIGINYKNTENEL